MRQDSIIAQQDSVVLPLYYRETFFANDSLYHPEVSGVRFGVAGDPVPYAAKNDNVISVVLLVCFVVTLLAYSVSKNFVLRQAKYFFYIPKSEYAMSETSNEYRFQFFLVLQTCLMLGLLYFFYIRNNIAETFILSEEYQMLGIFSGVICAYFLLKMLVYAIVNTVFFDGKSNQHFFRSVLFINATEGVLLYPAAVLLTFFDTDLGYITYYALFIIVLVKILTFYKTYVIFFRQNGLYLQIILYFCALEIIPMLSLWGGLEVIVNVLKINF